MTKTEIICESCDSHFIVVLKEDLPIQFCPFCSATIADTEIEEDE